MIKVLVVDDSAVMRSFLAGVVRAQNDMELVAVAADPVLAIERIRLHSPDVITLDVEMPRMNGLDFLRKLMSVRPLPVLMISSLTRDGADTTLRALELGAVDFFAKPADLSAFEASADEIADKIRAAAMAKVVRHSARVMPGSAMRPSSVPSGPSLVSRSVPDSRAVMAAGFTTSGQDGITKAPVLTANFRTHPLIAIGASTGGVEALREILQALPAAIPPILIAQHMPPGFTDTFARRLDAICQIHVKQAEDGETVYSGTAYIAPGGRHLTVARKASGYLLRVTDEAPVNRHRPSVDPLFRTVAKAAGARAIGIMLTGMGADGADAMLELRNTGAHTIAQDEASCIVFGMPKQAIAAGAVREILPLKEMAARLIALSG